jgi:hypothetical protein
MPASLPSQVTQTADGRDLYVYDNVGYPNGTVAYFNTVVAPSGGAPGGTVPFNLTYPVYDPAVPSAIGIGQGIPIPPGVYLARLSVPAVGESGTGQTKGCFTFTWDGTQLTAGATYSPVNFNQSSCYIATQTNGVTGLANILVWGWVNLVGANVTATIEVVLLQQLPYILPLV